MNEQFAADLDSIHWFASVGQPPQTASAVPLVAAGSQLDALRRCSDPAWEDGTLDARNCLTLFLHQRYRERNRQWNEVTRAAKARIVTPLVVIGQHTCPYISRYKRMSKAWSGMGLRRNGSKKGSCPKTPENGGFGADRPEMPILNAFP